jgi:hypothetical protein
LEVIFPSHGFVWHFNAGSWLYGYVIWFWLMRLWHVALAYGSGIWLWLALAHGFVWLWHMASYVLINGQCGSGFSFLFGSGAWLWFAFMALASDVADMASDVADMADVASDI